MLLRWQVWSDKGADPWVVEVLRWGYLIPFRRAPPFIQGTHPLPGLQSRFHPGQGFGGGGTFSAGEGSNRLAPLPSPGYCSWLFVVMKASGSWRSVIDLSLLNLRVQKTSFKMETLQSVLLSVRAGDWMVSLDLKDAYL